MVLADIIPPSNHHHYHQSSNFLHYWLCLHQRWDWTSWRIEVAILWTTEPPFAAPRFVYFGAVGAGGRGTIAPFPQILVKMLTLFVPEGRLHPIRYYSPPWIFKPSYGPPNGSPCCGWLAKRPIDFYILHAMMMPLKAAIYHSILYCLPTLFFLPTLKDGLVPTQELQPCLYASGLLNYFLFLITE